VMKKLLLLTSIFCVSLSAASKLAPDLPTSGPAIDVIVRFKNPPTKDDLKLLGPYGQIKKMLNLINAVDITLTPAQIRALANVPTIAYISPSRPMKSSLDITTSSVSANLAWNLGWSGAGVGVVVIDSGVALKHDLAAADGMTSRVVYSENFVAGETTADLYGHGTHVAGIIGSNGADSQGSGYSRTFKGVAPGVNIISLKALNQNGAGDEATVIAAIQTAVALKGTYNIRVLNLSLGRPVFESYTVDPLCQAVEAAWKSGIVVVVAAGNYGRDNARWTKGYGTIQSPGNDPYVITVGATNSRGTPSPYDDSIASYSSKGPTAIDHIAKPDLVAPGNGVVSLLSSPTCTIYQLYSKTRVQESFYDLTPAGVSQSYYRLSGTRSATA
jgi:serine protease AprX